MAESLAKKKTSSKDKLLKMRELSEITGVPPGTIRYYINEGLLPKPIKTHRNMAYYDQSYVGQINLIRELQEKRFFPLSVIKKIIEQNNNQMGNDEVKTILELEGKLFKNISSLPKFQPPTIEELSARTGVEIESIEEMENMRIISRQPDGRFDEDCVEVVEILHKLREAGYSEESGFTSGFIEIYRDMIEVLAQRELAAFSKAVTGKLSFDEMTEMAETGINLLNNLIGIIRKRAILRISRELDREQAE